VKGDTFLFSPETRRVIAFDIYVFITIAGSITSDSGLLVHGVIIW